MLIHLFVSVPRNDYLDEDMPDDEGIPGRPGDIGIPDLSEEDIAACPIPSQPSRFPSSTGPPIHHAFHHPLAVQDPGQRTRVMPRPGTPCPGGTWPKRCARLVFQRSYAEIYTKIYTKYI
jgi:hypothetical protein